MRSQGRHQGSRSGEQRARVLIEFASLIMDDHQSTEIDFSVNQNERGRKGDQQRCPNFQSQFDVRPR
jgi:hypothetical protein